MWDDIPQQFLTGNWTQSTSRIRIQSVSKNDLNTCPIHLKGKSQTVNFSATDFKTAMRKKKRDMSLLDVESARINPIKIGLICILKRGKIHHFIYKIYAEAVDFRHRFRCMNTPLDTAWGRLIIYSLRILNPCWKLQF